MADASLVEYDSKRFAVCLPCKDQHRVMRGVAQFSEDADLGPILRIEMETSGDSAFAIIVEQARWQGTISPGFEYDCDFLLDPRNPVA